METIIKVDENLCIGCGSCIRACQPYQPMIKMMGLPEGYIPYGRAVIGYPAETYLRIP
jgi:ferredoxin